MKYICIIPARLNSSRLPNKVIREMAGKTLVEHVVENAKAANLQNIAIACDSKEVMDLANQLNVRCIYTDPDIKTGTDRVSVAAKEIGDDFDIIVNMQGDLALFDATKLLEAIDLLDKHPEYDMTTLCVPLNDPSLIASPHTVKIAMSLKGKDYGDALYFSRSPIPHNTKQYYQHLGVYAFKRESILKFSSLQQSLLESTENLEQLRALENNMKIGVKIVENFAVQEINSEEDVELFESYMEKQ